MTTPNSQEDQHTSPDYGRLLRQLALRHWLIVVFGCLSIAGYAAYDYFFLLKRSEDNLTSIARLADEHLGKTVSETRLILHHLAGRVAAYGEPRFAKQAELRAILAE